MNSEYSNLKWNYNESQYQLDEITLFKKELVNLCLLNNFKNELFVKVMRSQLHERRTKWKDSFFFNWLHSS